MKNIIKKIIENCDNNCIDCDAMNIDDFCIFRMDDFPGTIDKNDVPYIFYSKSEADVICALKNGGVIITKKTGEYTKRHSRAIDKLKEKNIIYKDNNNILQLK